MRRARAALQRRRRVRRARGRGDAGGARRPAGARARRRTGRRGRPVRAGDRVPARPQRAARARQLRAARRRGAADRQTLLDRCPRLRVVVTSRVRLAHRRRVDRCRSRACPARGRGPRPPRVLRRGAAVRAAARRVEPASSPAAEAGGDRRHLPPGRGPAARARARGVVDARAVLRGDRRRAAPGQRAAARRRPDASGATGQHRDRLRPAWTTARPGRARGAGAAVGVPRRLHGRGGARGRGAAAGARRAADKSLLRKDEGALFPPSARASTGRRAARRRRGARRGRQRARAGYFHRLLAQMRRPVDDGDREALQRARRRVRQRTAAWQDAPRRGRPAASSPAAP